MADYWKSNAKKYCDFCKCWITDNKPSVEFHEKGRRHQENVSKRLKQITRNNTKIEHDNVKIDAAMAKMEAAAMDAYRKDVENNADMTSRAINKRLQDENLEVAGSSAGGKKIWREAKADKGTYYWNILTNESVWEPPKEGYLSILEAKELEELENSKAWKSYNQKLITNTRLQAQEEKKISEEERARLAREKLKERRVEQEKPVVAAPLLEEGKTNPYGRWQTVQIVEQEPEPATVEEIPLPEVPVEAPPRREFKEKTVEALADVAGSTQFKKRKQNGVNKRQRNTRARIDDD